MNKIYKIMLFPVLCFASIQVGVCNKNIIAVKDTSNQVVVNQETKQADVENAVKLSLLFDPLGFITLGPGLYLEPAIAKNVSLYAGIRFHNLGLLSGTMFGEMDFSYLTHFSARYYPKPKNRIDGFFFGPGLELGRSNYTSGNIYSVRAFGGELGYKWIFNNNFTLEIVDVIGLVQSKKIEDSYFGTQEGNWSTDMFVFYLLSIKLGYSF